MSQWKVGTFKRKGYKFVMYHVFGEILMQVELKYRCLHWKGVWKHLIIGKASVFLNNPILVEFCLLLKQSEFHHEIR